MKALFQVPLCIMCVLTAVNALPRNLREVVEVAESLTFVKASNDTKSMMFLVSRLRPLKVVARFHKAVRGRIKTLVC